MASRSPNSYGVFNTNGTSSFASSFAYWTDPVATTTTDTSPTMVDPKGTIAPAPWVPFTRAGCDVGAIATANIEVENSDPDLKSIYGANSPQWKEVLAEESKYGYADLSDADYEGIVVHCARTSSSVCAQNPSLAAPDRLPMSLAATRYQALYGNVNVGRLIGERRSRDRASGSVTSTVSRSRASTPAETSVRRTTGSPDSMSAPPRRWGTSRTCRSTVPITYGSIFRGESARHRGTVPASPGERGGAVCGREKPDSGAERTQPMLPMGLGYVEGVTHDYRRHGTTTLFAALDTAKGTVLTRCRQRHRHQEYLDFLRQIDQNVPPDLDVHVIVDNYATHKHPRVKRWLATRPRFHVHFTPTYASWLNQVEIWFNRITQRAIRRGTFRSVKELVTKIDQFVENDNRTPDPSSGRQPRIPSSLKSSDYVNVFPGQHTSSAHETGT